MPDTAAAPPARPADEVFDIIILGAGIAGLSAAIYTTRERLSTLVLEKTIPGGQILTTNRVENYPGFPEPVGGMELSDRLTDQAVRFGAEILTQSQVTRIEPHPTNGNHIDAFVGATRYRARAMILAVGSEYRKLNVPGEKRLTGYGVSYCGTCDAPFYRGKHVVVVGGGNTAIDEGLHLLQFAANLTIITSGREFSGCQMQVEELKKHADRTTVHYQCNVSEIIGKEKVEAVRCRDIKTNEDRVVPCDGVFVFIGLVPLTEFLQGVVDLDEEGFIRSNSCNLMTNLPGVWAAGDVRAGTQKQAATAAGDGVVAALMAKEYLHKLRGGVNAAEPRP
jgi:thioredoxin reductase (NADPH)